MQKQNRWPDEQTSGDNNMKRNRLCFENGRFRQQLDADKLAHTTAIAEFDNAIDLREKRIVRTETDVRARLDLGAALANDDGATRYDLASEHLDPQPLGV